ncbi:hypothetical protein JXM83_01405 [Candidatus Woesearchaeota archaeon]|nr:hypothetical protein [Candidatus Woesearchaeota archaeon]
MRRLYTFNTGSTMYHLGISGSNPNVITGGNPGRIKKIAEYLDSGYELIESERGLVTVHGTYKNLLVTAMSTGMGSASVSITLPEIIEACDDKDMIIIRLGTAGGLKKHLNIGDFVATTWVQRAESTSDKIMGVGYHAESDFDVRHALIDSANKTKFSYQQVYDGPTRVTDDIYFDALQSKIIDSGEVLAVSMEFSVYCALRDRYNIDDGRNIRVGNLLCISDNVVAEVEHVDVSEFQRRQAEIEDSHIRAGLDALVSLRH